MRNVTIGRTVFYGTLAATTLACGLLAAAPLQDKPRSSPPDEGAASTPPQTEPVSPVYEQADGTIMAFGEVYPNWTAWLTSAEFERRGLRCGTIAAPDQVNGGIAGGSTGDCSSASTNPAAIYDPSVSLIYIPVVVHVMHNGATGQLSVATVQSQINVLNEDFLSMAGTPGDPGTDVRIQFCLNTSVDTDGIRYHNNATWFNDAGAYYNTIAVDPQNNLNIYTANLGGLLGYATIPQSGGAGTAADRVVIHYQAFGDHPGTYFPYDTGRTATHEVGHYLGLYHTFQSGCGTTSSPGCFSTGDRICDTNGEATQHFGCATTANTCAGDAGNDPVRNYMSYSDDGCMNNFTPQQARRLRCTLEHWHPLVGQTTPCGGGGGCATVPTFAGNFTSTTNVLFSDVGTAGTTVFTAGATCPPGMSDGAGEGAFNYPCGAFAQPNNEVAYRIQHGGGDLRVTLTGLTTDIDLFLFGSAGTPASCLDFSENGATAAETVELLGAAPGTYYAVADAFGPNGPFTITYTAPPVGLNVDLNVAAGAGAGAPASAFAGAAGQAGTWTLLSDTAPTASLAVANGYVTAITLTRSTPLAFSFQNTNTTGNHELLLDDIHDVGAAGSIDTFTFAHLPKGKYRIYSYSIAPDNATFRTNLTVGGSPDGVQNVGGAMPVNSFAQGVTHAVHRVTVAPGANAVVTAATPTVPAGNFGTINGFQVVPRPACAGDIAPAGGNDVVDVNDLLLVVGNWGATVPPANLADVNGDGVVNVNDLLLVVGTWGACP